MSQPKEKFKNDRALRFYHEVLELDRLHYGYWTDHDPRTLEGVKVAQKRYEDLLVDKIATYYPNPPETRVLDVGCGTGVMTETLFGKKYKVEGLSPDLHQKEVFEKRLPVPFHLARFQNFQGEGRLYDLVLMSESSQYIPLSKLFQKASAIMKPGAHLVVCDYFTFNSASGPLAKSGHKLEKFMESAALNAFNLLEDQDITQQVIPTLEAAQIFTNKYILPSIDIFSEKFQHKKPFFFKTLKWFFRKKITKMQDNLVLIDPKAFAKNKCYKLMVFQKDQPGSAGMFG